jgi:hypothetical protein
MEVKAGKFISAIRERNKAMNIPEKVEGIVDKDILLYQVISK